MSSQTEIGFVISAASLNITDALPHFELLYRRALQCLTSEDVVAQRRYRYRDDALACVLGRLLTRRAFVEMGVAWHDANSRVQRSARGKPEDVRGELKFNVSHQGDLVVLAGTSDTVDESIGVDVMRVDQDKEEAKARIDRLKRAFTPLERETMLRWKTDKQRWRSFYRHWCLKEAVLKATGQGISKDLSKLEFRLREEVTEDSIVTSTEYYQDGVLQPQFIFEESNIGEAHVVAVGRIRRANSDPQSIMPFTMLDLPYLLEPATVENTLDDDAHEFAIYDAKTWKSF